MLLLGKWSCQKPMLGGSKKRELNIFKKLLKQIHGHSHGHHTRAQQTQEGEIL